jgi:hypothetical protein
MIAGASSEMKISERKNNFIENDISRDIVTGMQIGGPACRRAPNAITLAELCMRQRDASCTPPWRCQAISFACTDSLTNVCLIIQQDDESGDRGGGCGRPWRWRLALGPPPSSSGGDPVPKAQLAMVRPGEDMCHHLIGLV